MQQGTKALIDGFLYDVDQSTPVASVVTGKILDVDWIRETLCVQGDRYFIFTYGGPETMYSIDSLITPVDEKGRDEFLARSEVLLIMSD